MAFCRCVWDLSLSCFRYDRMIESWPILNYCLGWELVTKLLKVLVFRHFAFYISSRVLPFVSRTAVQTKSRETMAARP